MHTVSTSTKTDRNQVLVIGGGAAGMLAALFAVQAGSAVTLLERNEKLGKKIYITGKGRCNLTNTADFDVFFQHVTRNPKFLQAAIRKFSYVQLLNLMNELGVPTVEERGGRIFPQSQKASDITRALSRVLTQKGVEVRLQSRVCSLLYDAKEVTGVQLENGECLPAQAVVIATGGASYPATGSTGDGYTLAKTLGHTVHAPQPSLVPLITKMQWPTQLQGLTLKNVRLTAERAGKVIFQEIGEMLFTHFGISGPLVLELSSYVPEDAWEACKIWLDTKPGLNLQQLDLRLQRDFNEHSRKQLLHALPGLLPARMATIVLTLCGIPADKPIHQVTREERWRLVELLKAIPIAISGPRPLTEAIVTRGGVEVKEIDPSTMMSRLVAGVYFAGEVIDVDAHTGGFNLQIAFSTGALAGDHAARR